MEENEYILLILKHLNKETSPAEQAGLQQWLDTDPSHRREYAAVEKIWHDSGQVLADRQFDKEAAWKKLGETLTFPAQSQLQPLSSPPSDHRRPSVLGASYSLRPTRIGWRFRVRPLPRPLGFRQKWLAAASILLLLGLGGWWYYSEKVIGPRQVILAKDGPRHVPLPDGSFVDLRKGAELTYSEPFNEDRKVELKGEAFFLLATRPSGPFSIHTAHAIIEQMGTSLVVKDLPASDEVIVTTGKVKFTDRDDPSRNRIVRAGENMILAEERFTPSRKKDPNFMSWKTGVLDFRDEPLESAAAAVGDFFELPVFISPDLGGEIGKIKVNARFDHQPLEQVLEELRLTSGLDIQKRKDTLVFTIK
jgi:transmembrane sensor